MLTADAAAVVVQSQLVVDERVVEIYIRGIALSVGIAYATNTRPIYRTQAHWTWLTRGIDRASRKVEGGQVAAGVAITMATSKFDYIAGKFVRVTDTGVTGDETNNASGTTNGITYNNGGFALRYVIGV